MKDPREQLALFLRVGFRSNGAGWERRLYKRLHARVRRLERRQRLHEAALARRRRAQDLRLRERRNATKRRWYRRHRRRVARYNREYNLQFRGMPAPACQNCGRLTRRRRPLQLGARRLLVCTRCAS